VGEVTESYSPCSKISRHQSLDTTVPIQSDISSSHQHIEVVSTEYNDWNYWKLPLPVVTVSTVDNTPSPSIMTSHFDSNQSPANTGALLGCKRSLLLEDEREPEETSLPDDNILRGNKRVNHIE